MDDIIPDLWYSASAIRRLRILPWDSQVTINKYLKSPKGIELFGTIVSGTPNQNRYKIRGSAILAAIELIKKEGVDLIYESGKNLGKTESVPEAIGLTD